MIINPGVNHQFWRDHLTGTGVINQLAAIINPCVIINPGAPILQELGCKLKFRACLAPSTACAGEGHSAWEAPGEVTEVAAAATASAEVLGISRADVATVGVAPAGSDRLVHARQHVLMVRGLGECVLAQPHGQIRR